MNRMRGAEAVVGSALPNNPILLMATEPQDQRHHHTRFYADGGPIPPPVSADCNRESEWRIWFGVLMRMHGHEHATAYDN
jgi:hypothetical protein